MKNVTSHPVHRYETGRLDLDAETLAVECLVHINVNEKHVTSLLASPGDLADLARGHLRSEYGVHVSRDQFEVNVESTNDDYVIHVLGEEMVDLTSRSTIVTTSCGACEQDQLGALIDQIPSVSDTTTVYSIESLIRSLDDMRKHQPGFEKTGGMHAAGLFFGEPHDLLVREDIGRHNAVDKVIGALLESNTHPVPRALLLSGRCGWDIVSKAAKLDIPVIASIGAASTLAVKTARASNMTLVSFVKTDRAVVIGPVEGRIKRNH